MQYVTVRYSFPLPLKVLQEPTKQRGYAFVGFGTQLELDITQIESFFPPLISNPTMIKMLKRIANGFETMAMAVAFTEAGKWETSESILDKFEVINGSDNSKLLFVSTDADFSPNMIDYVVSLSSRLNYDVLAMNIFQPRTLNELIIKRRRQKTRILFYKSKEAFETLKEKTRECGIRCEHVITFDDTCSLIKKVHTLVNKIEFVLIQKNRNEKLYLDLNVPVFLAESEDFC